jgi:hypothetical protein
VLFHSRETKLDSAFGIFIVGTMVMGKVSMGNLELHGPLAALTDAVRDKFAVVRPGRLDGSGHRCPAAHQDLP